MPIRPRDIVLGGALLAGSGCKPEQAPNLVPEGPRIEQRDQSLDSLAAAHEDYLRTVRRFSFYGHYQGYEQMADYLDAHPDLQLDEDAFWEQIGEAEAEKDFLPEVTTGNEGYDAWLRDEAAQKDLAWTTDYLTAWMIAETFDGKQLNPRARSSAGAVGLFQFKDSTAREVGITNSRDPEQNIRGGVRLVALVKERYPELTTHWELILASGKGVTGFKEQVLTPAQERFNCKHPTPIQMLEVLRGNNEPGPREARRHILKMALFLDMIDLSDVSRYEDFNGDEDKLRTFIRQYGVVARNKYRQPAKR